MLRNQRQGSHPRARLEELVLRSSPSSSVSSDAKTSFRVDFLQRGLDSLSHRVRAPHGPKVHEEKARPLSKHVRMQRRDLKYHEPPTPKSPGLPRKRSTRNRQWLRFCPVQPPEN